MLEHTLAAGSDSTSENFSERRSSVTAFEIGRLVTSVVLLLIVPLLVVLLAVVVIVVPQLVVPITLATKVIHDHTVVLATTLRLGHDDIETGLIDGSNANAHHACRELRDLNSTLSGESDKFRVLQSQGPISIDKPQDATSTVLQKYGCRRLTITTGFSLLFATSSGLGKNVCTITRWHPFTCCVCASTVCGTARPVSSALSLLSCAHFACERTLTLLCRNETLKPPLTVAMVLGRVSLLIWVIKVETYPSVCRESQYGLQKGIVSGAQRDTYRVALGRELAHDGREAIVRVIHAVSLLYRSLGCRQSVADLGYELVVDE